MGNLNEMNYDKQCLLIGRVSRLYDSGMSMHEIAEEINMPESTVRSAMSIILTARSKK